LLGIVRRLQLRWLARPLWLKEVNFDCSFCPSASQPESCGAGQPNWQTARPTDDRPLQVGASGPQETSETPSSTAARPQVLALSDHITCLRQRNLRCRDDVITSGDHVTTGGVNGETW